MSPEIQKLAAEAIADQHVRAAHARAHLRRTVAAARVDLGLPRRSVIDLFFEGVAKMLRPRPSRFQPSAWTRAR